MIHALVINFLLKQHATELLDQDNKLVGVCHPVPQILTQFQTKTCHFPHPFSDLASKMHTRFQTFVVQSLFIAIFAIMNSMNGLKHEKG